MTPEEFRRYGHQLIDWIADYRSGISARPVMAQTTPGEIKAALPAAPPEHGEDFDAIFRDMESAILPGLSHWQHPSFFGYFPANAALAVSPCGPAAGARPKPVVTMWNAS